MGGVCALAGFLVGVGGEKGGGNPHQRAELPHDGRGACACVLRVANWCVYFGVGMQRAPFCLKRISPPLSTPRCSCRCRTARWMRAAMMTSAARSAALAARTARYESGVAEVLAVFSQGGLHSLRLQVWRGHCAHRTHDDYPSLTLPTNPEPPVCFR